jgi:hypothetical protein
MPGIDSRRLIASMVLLALASTVPAHAGGASLSGRVLDTDSRTPRGGVVVALVGADPDVVHRSASTGEDGAFAIADVDPGSYSLLVEAPQGAFLAPEPIVLERGANRPLALSMSMSMQDTGFGSPQSSGLSNLTKWIIVGAISAAALFVVADAGSDEDEPKEQDASPF